MYEDEAPILKLIMVKGPLSGRVSEFKPRSRVLIGRVVRGNTLAIKDDGVSSKHLTIQFEPGSGQWTVTDLNSSNGTILNTDSLEPSTPYPLSDGDIIKIGELTAIEVKLEVQIGEDVKVEDSKPKRTTRRRGAAEVEMGGEKLGIIDENNDLGLGFCEEIGKRKNARGGARRGRGRGRPPINEAEKSENLDGNNMVEENNVVNMRTTRSSKRRVDLGNVEEKQNVPVRRTRSSKKDETLENDQVLADVVLKKVKHRKIENTVEAGDETENIEVEADEETENAQEVINLNMDEGKRMRKGTEKKKDLQSEEGNLEAKEDLNQCGTSGVKENNVVVDLEKMTLGEWFDYLEEYLPKQIINETEEMILGLRQNAEKSHEYMLQRKAAEQQSPNN